MVLIVTRDGRVLQLIGEGRPLHQRNQHGSPLVVAGGRGNVKNTRPGRKGQKVRLLKEKIKDMRKRRSGAGGIEFHLGMKDRLLEMKGL